MLDIEQPAALWDYLREKGRIERHETPCHRVLKGGVSNRAVRVDRESGESWVLKQALPQLRVAVEWFSDPRRSRREALGIAWLRRLLPEGAVPGLVFQDDAHHLLAMEAVPEPHVNWKQQLLAGEVRPESTRQFATILAAIHNSAREHGVELAREFEDRSWFESLRLEPYYLFAASQVPQASSFLKALVAETRENRSTLVHGDYSPKNVLVHDGRLVLLDHEVIHFGDPAFDIGFSMTHLLAKGRHVPDGRRLFHEAALSCWRTYREAVDHDDSGFTARCVRHTLGCLVARVSGRSPLEYLTEQERDRQRHLAVGLMSNPPKDIPELIERFIGAAPIGQL